MKVIDCGKTIALLEKVKQLLPGDDGTLPKKFFTKSGMDTVIQGLRENSVDIDILGNMVGLAGKKRKSDTLLVGFDHSHGDIAVFIIGRRELGGKVQIVNQFQGKDAEAMYKKLVEKEG